MTDTRPVGILDSGFGGSPSPAPSPSCFRRKTSSTPPTAASPPGATERHDFILERTHALVSHLLRKDVKAIVIACNTATAVCAESLRAELSMPVVGIEPAVLPGARTTRTGIHRRDGRRRRRSQRQIPPPQVHRPQGGQDH